MHPSRSAAYRASSPAWCAAVRRRSTSFALAVAIALFTGEAWPEDAAPPPPPAPYSLPFQLRPVTVSTLARLDTSFGPYQNTLAQGGFATVSELSGSWRIPGTGAGPKTGLAPIVKLTMAYDSPPGTATGGLAFVNPLVGALYALNLGVASGGAPSWE